MSNFDEDPSTVGRVHITSEGVPVNFESGKSLRDQSDVIRVNLLQQAMEMGVFTKVDKHGRSVGFNKGLGVGIVSPDVLCQAWLNDRVRLRTSQAKTLARMQQKLEERLAARDATLNAARAARMAGGGAAGDENTL